jgi:hypothetical protein
MIERERQPAQRVRKRPCTRFVAAPRTARKKHDGFRDRQHVERHFLRPSAPVGKARRDQDPRASGGQEIGNLLGRRYVVVDEEPDFSLLGKPTQCRPGGLLDVGLLGRCDL